MVKDKTIVLLGLAGLGGYVLYKSDFFKGLGQVATGVGSTVEGLGQNVVLATSDLRALLGAVTQAGAQATPPIILQGGETIREVFYQTDRVIEEVGADLTQTLDNLGNIPVNTSGLASDWSKFLKDTWSPSSKTSIFQAPKLIKDYITSKKTTTTTTPPKATPTTNLNKLVTTSTKFIQSPLKTTTKAVAKGLNKLTSIFSKRK